METTKSRAFPRKVSIRKKDDERHFEELLADIPYKHSSKRYIVDGITVYHLRLKTQEILAFKLAGYEVRK